MGTAVGVIVAVGVGIGEGVEPWGFVSAGSGVVIEVGVRVGIGAEIAVGLALGSGVGVAAGTAVDVGIEVSEAGIAGDDNLVGIGFSSMEQPVNGLSNIIANPATTTRAETFTEGLPSCLTRAIKNLHLPVGAVGSLAPWVTIVPTALAAFPARRPSAKKVTVTVSAMPCS